MRLTRLALRNVRSYDRAEVEFGPGTTLITGDVGSGKTSLLYAIEMALFGFAEVDGAYLVRHQAREAEVTLALDGPDHRYELRRRLIRRTRRGKEVFEIEESSFAQDGARVNYSATELRQRAIDLLGFPDNPNPRAHSDLWRWAVYIPQERMREVLDQRPEDRRETIRKALGLEQYHLAAENAVEVAAELRRLAETKEAEATRLARAPEDLAQWSASRLACREGLESTLHQDAELRTAQSTRAAEIDRLDLELRAQADDDRELERLADEAGRLTRAIDERSGLVAQRRHESDALRSSAASGGGVGAPIESLRAEGAALQKDRDRVRLEARGADELRRALARADAERSAAESGLSAAAQRVEREAAERDRRAVDVSRIPPEAPTSAPPELSLPDLVDIDGRLASLEDSLAAAQSSRARWELEVREVEELLTAGVCPRCQQKVSPGEFGPHRDEYRQKLEEAKDRLAALQEERGRLRAQRGERERFERDQAAWKESRTRSEHARELLETARARLVDAEHTRDELLRQRDDAHRRSEELRTQLRPFDQTERRLTEIEAALDSANHRLQEAVEREERVRGLRERAALLDAEADRWEVELAEHRQRRSEVWSRKVAIEGRRPRRAALATRLEELRREAASGAEAIEASTRHMARLESQLDEAERRVREAERDVGEHRRLLGTVDHHRRLAQWLAQPFRETLLRLEQRLLARAQADFDRSFARYFATLIEDPSLIARSDVAFSPLVEIEGEPTPPEALSGGERTALALAYRLALGQVVRGAGRLRLETMILDEPTDGFSPEQVTRMGELLEELAVPQVILVSHEGGLASVADRVVRVRKEGGVSVAESTALPSDGPKASAGAPASPARAVREPEPRRRRVSTPRLDDPVPREVTPGTR